MSGMNDDYELERAAYDQDSEDWRLHVEHAFDVDPEEMERAQRLRAMDFYQQGLKWIGR